MATVNLSAWYDDVIPQVPGCPLPVALQKIRQAAIDFCEMSQAWRYLGLTAIDSQASVQTYVLGPSAAAGTVPADTKVVHIFQLNYDGEELAVVTPAEMRASSDVWFSETGDPSMFALFNEGEVSLAPIPATGVVGAIVIPEVALAPTQTALTIDARLFEKHREAIAIGARSLLMLMPKKPYTDGPLGMALDGQFRAMAGSAQIRTSSSRGHKRLRTRIIIR